MSQILELTDEQYETFVQAAAARGIASAELVSTWIAEVREGTREHQQYEADEWFRH